MNLRPYQSAGITALRNQLRAGHKRVCLVAPTGAGKTVIAGSIIDGMLAKGNRALFLAHRMELLTQPARLLSEMGHTFGMWRGAADPGDRSAPLQIASVQTLARRDPDKWPDAQIVFIDEAHRARAKTYDKILSHYPDAIVIGLTATPRRLDGKGLGETFAALVEIETVAGLVESGYLAPSVVYAPTLPDLAGASVVGGDWKQSDVVEAMRRSVLVGDIVAHWQRLALGRQTLLFAASVEHSQEICAAFVAAGVPAVHVDGETPEAERETAVAGLANGSVRVLCNYGVMVEGVDVPVVSCVILARATRSLTVYLQAVGRGMRMAPCKDDLIVLDHGGCSLWHGLPDTHRAWSLTSDKRKREASCKICPACMGVIEVWLRTCPHCHAEFAPEDSGPREIRQVDGQLVRVTSDAPTLCECGVVMRPEWRQGFSLLRKCPDCGTKKWGVDETAARAASTDDKRAEWRRLEAIRAAKGFRPGWVAYRYRAIFGVWPRGMKT